MSDYSAQRFLKRRSAEDGLALVIAAHAATRRLYCDVLRFWTNCPLRGCGRYRRCVGDPRQCLHRGLIHVPQAQRLRARAEVIAGGPRRLPPGSHMEWQVRQCDFTAVAIWPESRPERSRDARSR
jgi:hypothetical protein